MSTNYYLTGIEGMPKLFESTSEPLKYFKRNVYPQAFANLYKQNFETLDAIENGYKTVMDGDQFLTNMAEALVEVAANKMKECKKKRAQEAFQMDLNMQFAILIFPIILEYKGTSSQILCDKVLAAYTREFPKTNLSIAGYETIEKGFHRKFCYITTAVCNSVSKEDNCYELTLLRNYRDSYMASLENGQELIDRYYDVAPSIVKHINQCENSSEIYEGIMRDYISPCIQMIENKEYERCNDHYQKMVFDLKEKYFIRRFS